MARYVQDIRGSINREIDCSFGVNLGMLIGDYVSCKRVLIGRDAYTPSQMIKRAIGTGLMAAGVDVIDFGVATVPLIHYYLNKFNTHLMISVSRAPLKPEDINIKILSSHEIPLEHRPTGQVSWNQIGKLRYVNNYTEAYVNAVIEKISSSVKERGFMVVLGFDEGSPSGVENEILNCLECQTINISFRGSLFGEEFPTANESRLSMISDIVKATSADIGVIIDNDRDTIFFIDERGELIRDQTMLSIFSRDSLNRGEGAVVSSVVASKSLERVAGKNLIKTSVDQVLNEIHRSSAIFGGDEPGMYVFPEFHCCFDATFALLRLLEIMSLEDKTLHQLASEIEEYNRVQFSMHCANELKDLLIEKLVDDFEGHEVELCDGIRVEDPDGFLLIRPSRFEPVLRVYIESESSKKAQMKTKQIMALIDDRMSDLNGL